MPFRKRRPMLLALSAPSLAVAGVVAYGLAWPAFSHLEHPLALPGALGLAGATGYNLLVFVVPGALACALALMLYAALPGDAGWRRRIGARLLLLAGIALAAQGLLPLDPRDLDGAAGRLHAAAWTAWWIAGCTGLLALGAGRPPKPATLAVALALGALAAAPALPWPPALSQRLALSLWFAWWLGRAAAWPPRE